ncbi:glutamate--cysteine ligase [Novosphingobium capsulatum]|uniref:Glutamate--cysteine ligase n=1 Tax=Novosphingobium capsulatum TaxID=13688 RepID=A0ABU1MPA4_9SPHN|nr:MULTISPECIES: glutamate--cysteine ligase [Novosphingobium]MBB3359708.1 glutamate--cysteine ligase [Novosphingobium sp. BK256]MBB3375926.1 glutamate--cysteine ligase [Novosphingobium sp. BK280]MBB3380481.1 glutamate--cysteine ligase [Novosphingobium sp. BK258]MBB3422133.1 glutamate--cysteine ligase [Novosphingobium sp. BK267]MBB3450690.1 glutamate--cysteine ligase [Novosphingobium sp. BK352]
MSTRQVSDSNDPLIESRDQLVAPMQKGEKPREAWRIGTEHEKFVYRTADHAAPSYDEPGGIRDLLMALTEFGWEPVMEGGKVIAMSGPDGAVSLEPAGQLELSGAPLESLHETCAETGRHLAQVKTIGDRFGLAYLGLGLWPDKARGDLPIMPKGRYEIMLRHMPRVGTMGLDMMLRTCTIQTNLDYASEADMAQKFRVSLALQPLATALFANSPFLEGKPNGFLSYRSHIWSDTDPARTGMLPFVFEDGFGYERYVDYMLDVPMYFVFRDGKYIDAAGQSFRDFLDGKLPALPGEKPRKSDWIDHLSTAFPEVRLKSFLEMRGADGGPWNRICALPAFWVGLLYDQGALDAAWDLVKDWDMEGREILRASVPKLGLDAPLPGGGTLRDIAGRVLDIARSGLAARGRLNAAGDNETGYLLPLDEIVASGKTPAERLLDLYHGAWGGDLSKVYAAKSF